MKKALVSILILLPIYASANKDDTISTYFNKFRFYSRFDYNSTINSDPGNGESIFGSSVGFGIDLKDVKFEIDFPYYNNILTNSFSYNSFGGKAGLNFITKRNFFFSLLVHYQRLFYSEHVIEYDTGYPNIEIPVRYNINVSAKHFNYLVRFTRIIRNRFSITVDAGISSYEFSQESESVIDGTTSGSTHRLSDRDDRTNDVTRLNFGIGFHYNFNIKSE